jgi:hypothetical protein
MASPSKLCVFRIASPSSGHQTHAKCR